MAIHCCRAPCSDSLCLCMNCRTWFDLTVGLTTILWSMEPLSTASSGSHLRKMPESGSPSWRMSKTSSPMTRLYEPSLHSTSRELDSIGYWAAPLGSISLTSRPVAMPCSLSPGPLLSTAFIVVYPTPGLAPCAEALFES